MEDLTVKTMQTAESKAVLAHCMALTMLGESLVIKWHDGADTTEHELYVDDEPQYGSTADEIIDFIWQQMDLPKSEVDYILDGTLEFDRKKGCFRGTEQLVKIRETTMVCALDIRIPSELWFDALDIHVAVFNREAHLVRARYVLSNGPLTARHRLSWIDIGKELKNGILGLLRENGDIKDIRYLVTIPVGDFREEGSERVFTIREIPHTYHEATEYGVLISLR